MSREWENGEVDDLIAQQLEIILEKYRKYFSDDSDLTYYKEKDEYWHTLVNMHSRSTSASSVGGDWSDSKIEGECPHCGGDLETRNPKGYCDHLYYPDNCKTCQDILEGKHLKNNIIKDEDFEI